MAAEDNITAYILVIVSEGYKAPFIGFILSGECHVLKQLEVLGDLPNGEQVI